MSIPNHRPAQEAPNQAATLAMGGPGTCCGASGWGSHHLVKRTILARAEEISGGLYPAGFVLAAPAHASNDELLQLAADKDGWRREVLRIDPPLVCHSSRLGKKKTAASVEMTAEKWLEGATKMDGKFNGGQRNICKMGSRNNKSKSGKIAKRRR